MDIKHEIDIFIGKIKEKYKNIKIVCRYDEFDNDYMINHNRPDLDYTDTDFMKYTENLYCESFLDKDIYNVCFGYDVGEFPETGDELQEIVDKIAPIKTRENNVVSTISSDEFKDIIEFRKNEESKKPMNREYLFNDIGLGDSRYLPRDRSKNIPNYLN